MSVSDKIFNRVFSSLRVVVEHTFSGVKRCRIVKDVLRLTKEGISDLVMEIACGLHNLRVSFRKQIESVDLLNPSLELNSEVRNKELTDADFQPWVVRDTVSPLKSTKPFFNSRLEFSK